MHVTALLHKPTAEGLNVWFWYRATAADDVPDAFKGNYFLGTKTERGVVELAPERPIYVGNNMEKCFKKNKELGNSNSRNTIQYLYFKGPGWALFRQVPFIF